MELQEIKTAMEAMRLALIHHENHACPTFTEAHNTYSALMAAATCITELEDENKQLRGLLMSIANVIGSPKDVDRLPECLKSVLSSYRKRTEKTEAELKEIKRSYVEIMSEPCNGSDNRVHCTCVPVLRAELAAYRAKVQKLIEVCKDLYLPDDYEGWLLKQAIAEVISEKEDKNGNSDKTI